MPNLDKRKASYNLPSIIVKMLANLALLEHMKAQYTRPSTVKSRTK